MNVTYRGNVWRVESEKDIQTLIIWARLLTDLSALGLRPVPARVA